MSKTYTNFQDFGKDYNFQGEDYATANFTGSYSKNVSVENIVSNTLFLSKFEVRYIHEYINAYEQYKRMHSIRQKYSILQSQLN